MNRPNKKNDPNYPWEFPDTYLSELEKYCDALEKGIDKALDIVNKLFDEYEYPKCACIDCEDCASYMLCRRTPEEFKEWLKRIIQGEADER